MTLPNPFTLLSNSAVKQHPTLSLLEKEGFSASSYDLQGMMRVIHSWEDNGVDVYTFDGMLEEIAEKHQLKESK